MAGLLRLGTRGEDVKFLQASLNQLASLPGRRSRYAFLNADGIFGGKTRARVIEFQTASQLAVDGLVGPKTLSTLTELLATAPFSSKQAAGGVGAGPGKSGSGVKGSSGSKWLGGDTGGGSGKSGGAGGGGKFLKAPSRL